MTISAKPGTSYRYFAKKGILLTLLCLALTLPYGCGSSKAENVSSVDLSTANTTYTNEIKVLETSAPGTNTCGNDAITIDYSNSSEGYITVLYTGDSSKVKFQLTGPDQVTYTYNLEANTAAVLPLPAGNGSYQLTTYEVISENQYATSYSTDLDITIENVLGPFLYPNQYVNFTRDTKAVSKAKEVTATATCDLEAVSLVYDYVIKNVVYDKEEAETVASNYLPDVDEVMETGKGICFDYAALMAAMLRSQGIPTRLEIGYAKDAYHAWISVYTADQGWIGGVISFDGTTWTLMDPTLASNSKDVSKIKSFIGDGSSYTTKYVY